MADVNSAPILSKNRKLRKSKKKSWRASNVEDVAEFLEDERRQVRTGGLVAEKTDENLFVVDTGIKQADGAQQRKSKRIWRERQLKCYSLLQPDPHSKTARTPDHANFQKGIRNKRISDRKISRLQSQVRVAAQKQRHQYAETRKVLQAQKKQLPAVDTDVWLDGASVITPQGVKPPKRHYKKPSALKATVIPHPGASINPSFDDHQDLLFQAHIKEEMKAKKEKQLYNSLEAKFPSRDDAPNQFTYMEEMSAGLVDGSDDEDDDEGDVDAPLSVNPPVRREDRKTRKQRRKQKEQVDAAVKRVKLTEAKRKENMVLRIPSLKSDINKTEKKRKEKAVEKQKLKSLEPFKTKKLGKTKFEEADLDLKLSTELVASMREVKPEGHVLNDIYKSLQRRNIIEPRVRQKLTRKYRPKKFEKKGHKAIVL